MSRKHRPYSDKEEQELLDCTGSPIREALARLGLPKSTYYDWKIAGEIHKGLHTPPENFLRNFYLVTSTLS